MSKEQRHLTPADTMSVCWGMGGVDSTAMLIEMFRRGLRPSFITAADVGAEKPGNYAFIPIFTEWLLERDFPRPVICEYIPQDKTAARYREATIETLDRLNIKVDAITLTRLSRIFGNMVANETLPGIAFGMKSCSIKWKVEAQEPH